ncbi:MAG TPA: ribosome biogenesis GTPase Der [Gammaproteobacteria bacterium]|nr:ribosome biogenesis GTPase Der [Gammaproteobacteria bacterium]
MIPVIAIIGRPNVGKSTLFNYLTRSRTALVADEPGVTRDRQYGEGLFNERPFIVIDTGGMEQDEKNLETLMLKQTWAAIEEANVIFWVVDARVGLTPGDSHIAEQLRRLQKTIYVVVNKAEGGNKESACAEFYTLGMEPVLPIAAAQGIGVHDLLETALRQFPVTEAVQENKSQGIRVAIVGRPNAGKSTLVNRILGEERVLVYDAPGTTRDSVFVPFTRRDKDYVLIDTAGVRRKRSVEAGIEKFSVVKTLQAINEANVVIFVLDARQGVAEQDLHLLGFVIDSGKALVIAVNKWDGLAEDERASMRKAIDRRLQFVTYARVRYISALHGTGVGGLFPDVEEAYRSATKKFSASKLTELLNKAVESHQPPAVLGRRIKLRYAHVGGSNPPVIVIHGNQTEALSSSYRRYLANYFREQLSLVGTPIRIELRSGENPFQDKKNELTPRQVKRRKRLMEHVKKK